MSKIFYANSTQNHELGEHLLASKLMAEFCAKQLGCPDDLVEKAGLAAFLHDIGKATDFFQNILSKSLEKDPEQKYPFHQEVSWVISYGLFKSDNLQRLISQAVYWHHATYLFPDELEEKTASNIVSKMPDFDLVLNNAKNIIKKHIDYNKFFNEDFNHDNIENKQFPKLFEKENERSSIPKQNAQKYIIRSCSIFADHLISKLNNSELKDLIQNGCDKYFPHSSVKPKKIQYPINYDQGRLKIQESIINDLGRVTQINAPAGFGKTVIGTLFANKNKGRTYWVCPRNVVAESVYDSIKKELAAFNIDKSIELFLTSERKKCSNDRVRPGESDIVVTNIDNLLSPMISCKDKIFDVIASNIVFDEFHEFIDDNALFAAFCTLLDARLFFCTSSNIVLLSATPSLITDKYPNIKYLPEKGKHYPAQHNKLYNVSFSSHGNPKKKELHMFCSIKNVQEAFCHGYDIIAHSNYSDEDRSDIMKKIVHTFGKDGDKNASVVSAPILQAALDISFSSLKKTCESPENDIQTIGRVNRWGESESADIVFVNPFKEKSDLAKREQKSIQNRYDHKLSNLWNTFLEKNIGVFDLNKLYCIYNDFISTYSAEINESIKKQYDNGINALSEFYPKHPPKPSANDTASGIFSGKTLRNNYNAFFYVVKDTHGEWCDFVFTPASYETGAIENSNMNQKFATIIPNLEKKGFSYNISKRVKKIKPKHMKSMARCSSSPLPVTTRSYDKVLGLIIDKESES